MEFAINTAYMVEKLDSSKDKVERKNLTTGKTYKIHPSFSPRAWFDNIVKVSYHLDSNQKPSDLSDIRVLTPSDVKSLTDAMQKEHTRLGIDYTFHLKPNVIFSAMLTGVFEPTVSEYTDEETGEICYQLHVQYKYREPRQKLGLKIGSKK